MVQWGMELDFAGNRDERKKMLETLKEASEGKMFLEREYS